LDFGALARQWNHDPFGNGDPLGAFPYELRFPGQFFDQATYRHYNYFRDCDPRLGHYIGSDPIGLSGGINTYAYAGGDPVSGVDPLGLKKAGWGSVKILPRRTIGIAVQPSGVLRPLSICCFMRMGPRNINRALPMRNKGRLRWIGRPLWEGSRPLS
jgi:RHS repeat-associated protein